jgi:hypothetical protein
VRTTRISVDNPILLFLCVLFVLLVSTTADARSLVVITDMEPDDRISLILLAALDPETISLVGTTGLHAGRKAALARQLMDQLGLSNVPVVQGSGGLPADYPNISSSRAALSYRSEGKSLLSKERLAAFSQDVSRSSDDFQSRMRGLLEASNDVEILLLAPATDLVRVLEGDQELRAKIKHIHMMGGWSLTPGLNGDPVRWTSYNWNMAPEAAARLVQMREIPMTIYSTHMIKQDFSGGSINRDDFPEVIELLEDKASKNKWAESFFVASRSWDNHVLREIPYLVPIIGDRAGQQFTPADPLVVLGLSYDKLATRVQLIDISIDLEDLDLEQGYKVLVQENPASNIKSVEAIDVDVFRSQMSSMILSINTDNSQRGIP